MSRGQPVALYTCRCDEISQAHFNLGRVVWKESTDTKHTNGEETKEQIEVKMKTTWEYENKVNTKSLLISASEVGVW